MAGLVAAVTDDLSGISIAGNNTAVQGAAAANGNIYFTTAANAVNYTVPGQSGAFPLIELTFAPTAIAVDSVRGRIYLGDPAGSVVVYSTAGKLLHTIK